MSSYKHAPGAENAEGFSPQKTHRWPQLLSTFKANTCWPTRAAARRIGSVSVSDQMPSLARRAICSRKASSRAETAARTGRGRSSSPPCLESEEIGQGGLGLCPRRDPHSAARDIRGRNLPGHLGASAPARTSHLPPCEREPSRLAIFARTLEGGLENSRASEGTGSGAWGAGGATKALWLIWNEAARHKTTSRPEEIRLAFRRRPGLGA